MSQYRVTIDARRHIDQIWLYITQDKPGAADQWLLDLEKTFQRLAELPGMGRVRPELMPAPVHVWPTGDYLVLYRVKGVAVEILGVVHGARNWPRLARRSLL